MAQLLVASRPGRPSGTAGPPDLLDFLILSVEVAVRRFVMAVRMRMGGFEEADRPRQSHARQKRGRQLKAIVRVEFHFREQVAERDAEKDSGRHGQSEADDE
jgi:hypothetical protein